MPKIDYTARFETVGMLYYAETGYMRPGKSEPMVTNRDSSDPENVARFDEWMATRCFGAALDRIALLETKLENGSPADLCGEPSQKSPAPTSP